MRSAKSAPKSASPGTIGEYLAAVPEPARSTLNKVRALVLSAGPAEAAEDIVYRIPAFRYRGDPLFGFAAFAKHCSLFPMSGGVIASLQSELANYRTSKGAIQIPLDKAPPAALIRKLLKVRIAEIDRKKRG